MRNDRRPLDEGYIIQLPSWFVYSMSVLTVAIFGVTMFQTPIMMHANNVCSKLDTPELSPHTHTVPAVPQPQPQDSETGENHAPTTPVTP